MYDELMSDDERSSYEERSGKFFLIGIACRGSSVRASMRTATQFDGVISTTTGVLHYTLEIAFFLTFCTVVQYSEY